MDDDLDTLINELKLTKKKKKIKETPEQQEELDELSIYKIHLKRIYVNFLNNNIITEKQVIPVPKIDLFGSKRIIWTNFERICQVINRTKDDVSKFVLSELNTVGSINAKNQFIIKSVVKPQYILNILSSYIKRFVQCSECKSLNTRITRANKLTTLACDNCLAVKCINVYLE
jgi:translation initiation factor 2 subunit 2